MTHNTWSARDLELFGAAEEIQISTRGPDGRLRPFVPIWAVAVDAGLFVRSYRGSGGAWYRHATRNAAGVIRIPGHESDVAIAAADAAVREQVDAAYRVKYARYGDSYLQPMLADPAVETTLRIDPVN